MKNKLLTYITLYHKKAGIIIKSSLAIILMSFIAYAQPSSQPDDNKFASDSGEQSYRSSISIVNGQYVIDSSVVNADRNKALLVADLKKENLIRKTTVEEIPEFILDFLDSTSINKNFDIANPWEKWNTMDIMDLVIHRLDTDKKNEEVTQLIDVQKELPNKKLVYFSIGDNMALLSYHSGGIRAQQHILILKFKNEKIVDFWFGAYLGLYINTKIDILQQLEGRRNGHGC